MTVEIAGAAVRPQPRTRGLVLRQMAPLALAAVCLWIVGARFDGIAMPEVLRAASGVPALNWAGAVAAAALSFWAVGRYDLVMHRHLRTGAPAGAAARNGAAAIAVAQLAGCGIITGALARWRLMPWLGPARAAALSAWVAASFMAALATVTALALLVLPAPPGLRAAAILVLAAAGALAALAFWQPVLRIGRWRLHLPSLRAMGAVLLWAAADTGAAGLCLWLLMPQEAAIGFGFATFLPVYLLALGAALASGTPGGAGPFELTLMALLPVTEGAPLLAAILSYRLVYFALPALLGAALLLRQGPTAAPIAGPPRLMRPVPRDLAGFASAEVGVIAQNGGAILAAGATRMAVQRSGQSLVSMFDMAGPVTPSALAALRQAARAENRLPALYKCGPRAAAAARKAGWQVLRVAEDARLRTAEWDLQSPRCRQLRRKLNKAAREGLTAAPAEGPLPLAAMTRVAEAWAAAHGGERGFSMGRFDPAYAAAQTVILAWQNGRLAGFVTCHANRHELALDLVRICPEAPDGTGHALAAAMIEEARRRALPEVSLAAVCSAATPGENRLLQALRTRAGKAAGRAGLRQFKAAFAPHWRPLYLAAPSRLALALTAADLARAVRQGPAVSGPAHDLHEENEFAPAGPT